MVGAMWKTTILVALLIGYTLLFWVVVFRSISCRCFNWPVSTQEEWAAFGLAVALICLCLHNDE